MKLWKLEAVRGLAALYVVLGHTLSNSYFLFRFGQGAVMVFFLLSGFVIEYSQERSRDKSFRTYFVRRFVRIYSVFIPMLILAGLLVRPDVTQWGFWKTLGGNLLMLQDFAEGKPHVIVPTLFASALWSLHYEWWFYMLYHPVAHRIERRRQTAVVAAVAVGSALVYVFLPQALPRLLMYFIIWWTGVDLARSYQAHGRVRPRDVLPAGMALLVVTAILAINVQVHRAELGPILFGVHPVLELRHFVAAVAVVVVALAWQTAGWRGFFLLKPGVLLAPISYSLYIAHQPLLAEAEYFSWLHNDLLEHALYLVVLLGFCWLTELKLFPVIRKRLARSEPRDALRRPDTLDRSS